MYNDNASEMSTDRLNDALDFYQKQIEAGIDNVAGFTTQDEYDGYTHDLRRMVELLEENKRRVFQQ